MAIFYNFLTNENALMAQVGSKRKLRREANYDRVGIWRRLMGHTTGRQQKTTGKGLNPPKPEC
jgi:hypothetical protein